MNKKGFGFWIVVLIIALIVYMGFFGLIIWGIGNFIIFILERLNYEWTYLHSFVTGFIITVMYCILCSSDKE